MKLRLIAIVLGVVACTDFSDVARDGCGNGLLEAGEDCDSDDASCVRCAVTCSAAVDCPTADYTCGVDGFCHAPGGLLGEPTAPVTFQADDVRITDIDRDGTGDVLAFGTTTGSLWISEDGGESWQTISNHLPPVYAVRFAEGTADA